ncbi:hypothetical protein [Kurthia senegalensis]|uniref:hypothetical protein n=1 Tax=Kurthia senegalensis TaxID=1033740 RepID=UPI0002890A71|nr:hypothetical protein [Kurthia senegalensis]
MNIVYWLILVAGLIVSSVLCGICKNKVGSNWLILYAFIFNTLFFSISSVILYAINAQAFHKNSELGIMTLLFFVPLITWLNAIFIRFQKAA